MYLIIAACCLIHIYVAVGWELDEIGIGTAIMWGGAELFIGNAAVIGGAHYRIHLAWQMRRSRNMYGYNT